MGGESKSLPKIWLKQWEFLMRGWLRFKKRRNKLMIPSFISSPIFIKGIILDLTQAMFLKKGKVWKSTQEATLERGLQVQERVLWAGHIMYICQGLLLAGHVILEVLEVSQIIPLADSNDVLLKVSHKENSERQGHLHLMEKVKQARKQKHGFLEWRNILGSMITQEMKRP